MSREIKTTACGLSIDPDTVPDGMMLVELLLPLADVANLTLGTPVVVTVPDGAAR